MQKFLLILNYVMLAYYIDPWSFHHTFCNWDRELGIELLIFELECIQFDVLVGPVLLPQVVEVKVFLCEDCVTESTSEVLPLSDCLQRF